MSVYPYRTKRRGILFFYRLRYRGRQYRKDGFPSREEARKAEASLLLLLGSGERHDITWSELLLAFGEDYRLRVKSTTYHGFELRKKAYYASFPDVRLSEIGYPLLSFWWGRLKCSVSTRKRILSDFGHLFSYAGYMFGISIESYRKLAVPKDYSVRRPKTLYVLSLADFRRFYEILKTDYWRLFFLTAFVCGLRIGEIRGLQKEAFSETDGTLLVYQQASSKTGKGRTELISPKTDSSVRSYVLPPLLSGRIVAWIRENGLKGKDFLFFSSRGKDVPVDANRVYCAFREARDLSSLPHDLTFHVFRKSEASLLNDAGIGGNVIRDYLGHGSFETTRKYYIGDTEEKREEIADILEKKLEPLSGKKKDV